MSSIARAACVALLFSLPLVACDDGPAENVGERIDRAGEQVRDAVDPPSGPVERAGRAIDRAVD
jgi:predicted small secreted protein